MTRQVTITASEALRGFGKLLKRVYGSDEHLIIERDGSPMAVLISYQEYAHFSQGAAETETATQPPLPAPTLTLEQTYGSVSPLNRPEDFAALREIAIEELAQRTVDKMKGA